MGGAVRLHLVVWVALMALLSLTVGLTFVPLGPWRLAASLAIAAAKAGLVGWVFMEFRAAPATVRLVAAASVIILLVLIFLSGLDALARMSLA